MIAAWPSGVIAHNTWRIQYAYYRAGVECARVHFAELRAEHPTILRIMREGRRAAILELEAVETEVLGIAEEVRVRIFEHHPNLPMGEPS